MSVHTVLVITCYFDPRYVRGEVIRSALAADPRFVVVVVRNRLTGMLRYPEVAVRALGAVLRHRPQLIVLTFRGQELLGYVLALAAGRPVVFDEFIVPAAYALEPHRRSAAIVVKHTLVKLFSSVYALWLRRVAVILADTAAHAEISSELSRVPRDRYVVMPVSADEMLFVPGKRIPRPLDERLHVFYYGNMLPLHGVEYVLDAAARLAASGCNVRFTLAGGGRTTSDAVDAARGAGAVIDHLEWIDYEDIPAMIADADLCLGGPFGDTPQARRVVTGKTYQFLASGAPVLVGANPVETAFVDRVNSLIVPQGDATAIVDAVQWAESHRGDLVVIGAAGRRLYEQSFSGSVVAGLLTDRVTHLLESGRG